jgi:hypothetical protein
MINTQNSLFEDYGTPLQHDGVGVGVVSLTHSVAFTYGDGILLWDGQKIQVHAGAILCAKATPQGDAIITGGDDGRVVITRLGCAPQTLAHHPARWVIALDISLQGKIAYSLGKELCLITQEGEKLASPVLQAATLSDLAFDPKGKRLAASHYGGVSLWWVGDLQAKPATLEWKAAHNRIIWSPDGAYVVTAMQETALHGWRVRDGTHMRMAGYPTKTKSMAWSYKGRYLATSGAPPVVCWPFFHKDGPIGRAPLELPPVSPAFCTAVAGHPQQDIIAAGYEDGSILFFRVEDIADLPVLTPHEAAGKEAAVVGLAFSRQGSTFGFLRENGEAGILKLP